MQDTKTKIKIGYMGIAGSFSEMAAHALVEQLNWDDVEYLPLICSQNILDELRKGAIDYGVLGIENSSAGPVEEFVTAFAGISYETLSEYILPIHHCLFKKNAAITPEHLTTVASHPQALTQTAGTRAKEYPNLEEREVEDTALAAEWLADGTLPDTTAVICSQIGGDLWGLDRMAENIEDSSTNRTTFRLLKLI